MFGLIKAIIDATKAIRALVGGIETHAQRLLEHEIAINDHRQQIVAALDRNTDAILTLAESINPTQKKATSVTLRTEAEPLEGS